MSELRVNDVLAVLLLAALGTGSAEAQEGWYAGDLHAHSLHSDGDSSVADILGVAEDRGLDFFALTDHDSSMGGEPNHWYDPTYVSDKLILLYGIEWTTSIGHGNMWAAEPFDYRPMWSANLAQDPWAAAEAAHEAGALFSANHPTTWICCPWLMEAGMLDGVEVWNGTHRFPVDYPATRRFWSDLLLSGARPTAVGGSDTHDLAYPLGALFTIGDPTTWVFSAGLEAAQIIEGIGAGRVSVSYDPHGPRVDVWADGDSDGIFETAMGEDVTYGPVRLRVNLGTESSDRSGVGVEVDIRNARGLFNGEVSPSELATLGHLVGEEACGPGYLIGLYHDDRLARVARLPCDGGSWEVDMTGNTGDFFRVEVLGLPKVNPIKHPVFGLFVALSNPIYVR